MFKKKIREMLEKVIEIDNVMVNKKDEEGRNGFEDGKKLRS